MPIVHGPTFSLDEKPDILILAMQACGALYVKTPTAAQFIDRTLSSTRDQIVAAFVSLPNLSRSTLILLCIDNRVPTRLPTRKVWKTGFI